jgi:DNA-binding XRE family transcriptional regulator
MSKKRSPKIQKAIDEGRLIPYEQVFASYSKREQEEISRRARYLKASMELRRLRKENKLSQAGLAKKMNVKREFISRIESGTQNITLNTLYRIGDVMGKEVEVTFK